jgi:hypothetical protein
MSSRSAAKVIDTNVAIAANGKATASAECVRACVRVLQDLTREGHLVLDDTRLIFAEYRAHLHGSGQPGVGDAFLKWVYDYQYNPARCTRIPLAVTGAAHDFAEFPNDDELRSIVDPADRKFIAVAAACPRRPPIVEATDSKWLDWIEGLGRHGIAVEFPCEAELRATHARKRRNRKL